MTSIHTPPQEPSTQTEPNGHINGIQSPTNEKPSTPDPLPPRGTLLEVKIVDQIWDNEKRKWKEVENKPDATDKDTYAPYVFVVLRKMDSSDDSGDDDVGDGRLGSSAPKITTVAQINSIPLGTALKDVIGNDQGVAWDAKTLSIGLQIILTFFANIRARVTTLKGKKVQSESETLVISHLEHFIQYFEAEFEYATVLDEIKSLTVRKETTFRLLWAFFVPGDVLFTRCSVSNEPRAVKLLRVERKTRYYPEKRQYWRLFCRFVEADRLAKLDQPYGYAIAHIDIMEFEGVLSLRSLEGYPMKMHKDEKEMRATLLTRGRKWANLNAIRHRRYSGIAFRFNRDGVPVKTLTDGRIMIDSKTFDAMEPFYDPPEVQVPISRLDSDLLLITPAVVYGFSLVDKLWLAFSVKEVKEIEWDDHAFEKLVLPENTKKLIKALVEHREEAKSADPEFDDFISSKGRGLVVNLFGKPGVGKTLTVEATSELLYRPLYVVSAGDLGTTAATLDASLSKIFKITTAWNAIVIIDEADVFLEKRSLRDLERNAMVAVFLRQLEYFQGILFLTTNRVRVFDEAFQSRIHVSLHYTDLDESSKAKIWESFLHKARKDYVSPLSAEQLKSLSARDLNGRQIKNIVKTATALAQSDKEKVEYRHLVQVLDVMMEFDSNNMSTQTRQTVYRYWSWLSQTIYSLSLDYARATLVLVFLMTLTLVLVVET